MNLRRTRAVAKKEFVHIVRDARSLILALALPMLMILLFGFQASRYFKIVKMADTQRAIERGIDRGDVGLGIVIAHDYSEKLLTGRQAQVQLLFDGSDSNTASIAVGYASTVVQTYTVELRDQFMNRSSYSCPVCQPRPRNGRW